jgi:Mrp family chromosome partitioning ATPase
MVTSEQVEQALTQVMDPELGRNVVELGMVRNLRIYDSTVELMLALTIPECPMREQIAADARAAVRGIEGIKNVRVTLGAMSAEERAVALGRQNQPPARSTPPFNHIKHVVAIASGKGGVGKSSVTALLAVALARMNHRVGILDADVTGPSIPQFFGVHGAPGMSVLGILPPVTGLGIKVISVNLLLPSEDDAVIWRGPMIGQVIQQFWNEVVWGDLDYLLVDLPPGTSDAPLTVMQSLPLDGMVLVTSPQDLAAMVVRKARHMAEQMNTPILGVVENMSGFICPTCSTRHELFGKSHTDASRIGNAPLLARLAIAPELAAMGDSGSIESYESSDANALAAAFLAVVPERASVQVGGKV